MLRGSTVSLNCSTDANPVAHVYQLYFYDAIIGNSSLGVFNITVNAGGVYTCVPINKVGPGRNATISITMVGKYVRNFLQLQNFENTVFNETCETSGNVVRMKLM